MLWSHPSYTVRKIVKREKKRRTYSRSKITRSHGAKELSHFDGTSNGPSGKVGWTSRQDKPESCNVSLTIHDNRVERAFDQIPRNIGTEKTIQTLEFARERWIESTVVPSRSRMIRSQQGSLNKPYPMHLYCE